MTTSNELEIFSTKICSNLKILSIICSKNVIFLNAHLWEQLILHYYPQLEKFYFTYYDRMSNNNQYEIYSVQVNQFSSSFWIGRKWIFDVEIKFANVTYMIRPYSKKWYDDTKDNNVNCSIEYSKLPDFTFVHTSDFMLEGIIAKKIERALSITQK